MSPIHVLCTLFSHRVKSHSIVGLGKRKKSPFKDATNFDKFNIMKKSRMADVSSSKSPGLVLGAQLSSQPSSSSALPPSLKRANSELFYDGFGGHSKSDAFPSLRRDPFKLSKKPKGVARPKSNLNASQARGQKLMDQFFSDLQ